MRRIGIVAACAALVALGAPLAPAAGAGPRPAGVRVEVAITRYHGFVLSRRRVPLGDVVFVVVDRDPYFGHDFAIPPLGVGAWIGKTPALLPHQRYVLRVRFRVRGDYEYFSTLHDQAEAGYVGVLHVG